MEQTLVEQVQESILLEYLDFKEKELQKSKEEIFRDYYEIHFYEELSNFISCGEDILDEKHFRCLSKEKDLIMKGLLDVVDKKGYTFRYATEEELGKGCEGLCNYNTKEILVKEGISDLQTVSVLVHEYGHEERCNLITLIIKEIYFNENNQIGKIIFKFNIPQEEANVIKIQNKVVDDSVVIEMNIDGEAVGGVIPFREVPNRQVKPKTIKEKAVKEKIPKLIEKKPRPEQYKRKTATYKQIQEYIKQEFGLIAHSSYIAEIKRKYGVGMQSNRRKDGTKQPVDHPTKEMTKAIETALLHFKIINEN